MATYRIKLARTDPDAEKLFTLDLDSRMTVLDALFIIQREHDPSLSFRCSCRVGMCGTCAMRINWMPRLACQTRVETLNAESITIEPLATLPVTKDLVVDLGPFFAKWKKVRPRSTPRTKTPKNSPSSRPTPSSAARPKCKRDCITCGACYSVCGIAGSNAEYLGPAAINRAMLRLLDPRDGNVDDRLAVLNDETGVWRCHTQFNCVAACPKGINLTDSIMKMKRSLLFPKKFHDK